jgi:hypothetical protein
MAKIIPTAPPQEAVSTVAASLMITPTRLEPARSPRMERGCLGSKKNAAGKIAYEETYEKIKEADLI